jgi:hypothetical protein
MFLEYPISKITTLYLHTLHICPQNLGTVHFYMIQISGTYYYTLAPTKCLCYHTQCRSMLSVYPEAIEGRKTVHVVFKYLSRSLL